MPEPIQYPTSNTYEALASSVQRDLNRVRGIAERRAEALPRLRSQFNRINETCFGGRLPMPTMRFASLDRTVAAQCASRRAFAWSEPFTLEFSDRHMDSPKELTRFLAHEVAHLAGFAVDEWYETEHHGQRFEAILDAIERGVPYGGEVRKAAPTAAPSRSTRSRSRSRPTEIRWDPHGRGAICRDHQDCFYMPAVA